MRKLNNYEAVKIISAEEGIEFLQYLEDNTNLEWNVGEKPTEMSKEQFIFWGLPVFIERCGYRLWLSKFEHELEAKTKVIPITEFI